MQIDIIIANSLNILIRFIIVLSFGAKQNTSVQHTTTDRNVKARATATYVAKAPDELVALQCVSKYLRNTNSPSQMLLIKLSSAQDCVFANQQTKAEKGEKKRVYKRH